MPKTERTHKVFWTLINTGLVLLIILMAFSAKALWRYGTSVAPSRTINVSGEGKTIVAPDIATLSFSVVSEGEDPEKLQDDNNKKINAAIKFVKSEGVDEKDIKTAGYNLSPRYEYDKESRNSFISGYTLRQTVALKIRDFDKTSKILGALPGMGINQIGSLNFTIDDPDKFLNEAREEAFSKAFAKAKAMAEQNGVRIRRVVTFGESFGGYPAPFYAEARALSADGGVPAPAPTIEPGTQEVTVNVNVTYEIW